MIQRKVLLATAGLITAIVIVIVIVATWAAHRNDEPSAEVKLHGSKGPQPTAVRAPATPQDCEVNVRVTDDESNPVADAAVCVHSAHDLGRQHCGPTSDEGVVGLSWGCLSTSESMIVIARKAAHTQLRNAKFVARPGEVSRVAVTLTQIDYGLEGRVEDILGGPIEGAWIWATCEGESSTWGNAWDADAVSSAVSVESGEFALGFKRKCKLDELMIKAEGYANYSRSISKDDALIVARLVPAAMIRGRVVAEGRSVEGALVVATTGRFGETEDLRALSGSDGQFEIQGVPPGQWVVRATKHDALGTAADMVTVDMGEKADGVLVQLGQMSSVDVTVGNVKAGFCGEALASLWPVSELGLAFGALETISLDEDHHGSFRAVANGKYQIKVRCSGYALAQSVEFDLRAVESKHISVQMAGGEQLAGRVVDAGGQPVPFCSVTVGGAKQRCDENGDFAFQVELTYPAKLSASSPDGGLAEIVLNEHSKEHLTVPLLQQIEFDGSVVSASGLGISRAQITSPSIDGDALQCSRSAPDGSFSCRYAAAFGSWTGLIEAKRGEVVLGQAVVSEEGQVVIQTTTMDIEGQVVHGSGEPAEFAHVNLFEEVEGRRASIGSVQADVEGRFQIGGALSGRAHHVSVFAPDGASVEVEVGTNPMVVELPNSVALMLDVQGCDPGMTGQVGVYRQGQMLPTIARSVMLTSGESKVVLGRVSGGTYEIRAEFPGCGAKKIPHVVERREVESIVNLVF